MRKTKKTIVSTNGHIFLAILFLKGFKKGRKEGRSMNSPMAATMRASYRNPNTMADPGKGLPGLR